MFFLFGEIIVGLELTWGAVLPFDRRNLFFLLKDDWFLFSFFLFFSHQPLDLDTNVTSAIRIKHNTPFNDGPLGSRNDEERGKMRKCSMNCRI